MRLPNANASHDALGAWAFVCTFALIAIHSAPVFRYFSYFISLPSHCSVSSLLSLDFTLDADSRNTRESRNSRKLCNLIWDYLSGCECACMGRLIDDRSWRNAIDLLEPPFSTRLGTAELIGCVQPMTFQ